MIAEVGTRRTGGRVMLAAIVVALHVVVVVVLLARPRHPAQRPPMVAVMTLTEVPATPLPLRPDPPAPFLAASLPVPVDIVAPNAAAVTACDVLAQVGDTLRGDAAVATALEQAPSTTSAVMAWNGQWSATPENPPIRRAIGAALHAVRADCLDEPMIGPRLVFFTSGATTVSVAIGSGNWRWRDLLLSE